MRTRRFERTARSTIGTAIALGGGWTVLVAFELIRPVHVEDHAVRVVIETSITMWALVGACLLLARFNHSRQLRDLLLLGALVAVSVTDSIFFVLPGLTGSGIVESATGATLGCQVLVAVALAAAAFAPRQTVVGAGRRPIGVAVLVGLGTIAVSGLLGLATGTGSAAATHQTGLAAAAMHPVSLVVAIGSAGLLLAAGIAFARRAALGNRDAGLLAGVSLLLAAVRLQYLAFPAVSADWITPRDGLRLAAYALLLTVAVRRYADMRTGAAYEALVAERERIARDLHDGLAQDLAFIAAHGERLAAQFGAEHPLVIAARRALAVSRGTIVDLSASTAPTTAGALQSVADELERRFEVRVDVDVAGAADGDGIELDPVDREAVVRIAREAIVNAIRHGKARRISVELGSLRSASLLRITDDGCGIGRPGARSRDGSGVGLPAMRARAESVGGRLVARPGPAGGTQVEVLVS